MQLEGDDLGTILGVWAHPDDDAYLSGALMAAAVDGGRRVVCVTATRGEAGFPDDDGRSVDERAAVRTTESEACFAILGVSEHHWLGYPDGRCVSVAAAEPVEKLAALMRELEPDTVLTFGPEGMTGHGDHIAVSRWTTLAFRQSQPAGRLLYAAKTPDWNERFSAFVDLDMVMMIDGMEPPAVAPEDLAVCFRAEGPLLETKTRSLRAQPSQIDPLYNLVGDAAFRDLTAEEFFREPRADDWPEDSR